MMPLNSNEIWVEDCSIVAILEMLIIKMLGVLVLVSEFICMKKIVVLIE